MINNKHLYYVGFTTLIPLLVLMFLVISFSLEAQEEFFVGGRFGSSNFEGACNEDAFSCSNTPLAMGIYSGYQVDNVGVSLDFTNYGEPSATYSEGNVLSSTFGVGISLIINWDVSEQWRFFSRLGATYIYIDKQSDWEDEKIGQSTHPLVSLGVSYQLSSRWELQSEYLFINNVGDDNTLGADLYLASIGLTYHFKQKPNHKDINKPIIKYAQNNVVALKKVIVSLQFDLDSTTVHHRDELQNLVHDLKKYRPQKVLIVGHTDRYGSLDYNQKLSEKRAWAVTNYLIQEGVDSKTITTDGKGYGEPIADNDTYFGRAENRRVTIEFYIPDEE